MAVSSVAELRSVIQQRYDETYAAKMLHTVPEWPAIKDRSEYLKEKATGQVVLDLGCTGNLSKRIRAAASKYYGVDIREGEWDVVDLDKNPEKLPSYPDVTMVIASEIIEHLTNPGRLLEEIARKYPNIDTYISVPNAGAYTVVDGKEMVNKDHVAWYSYTTLSTLTDKCGFDVCDCVWYNGRPHKAEGLIIKVLTKDGPKVHQGTN